MPGSIPFSGALGGPPPTFDVFSFEGAVTATLLAQPYVTVVTNGLDVTSNVAGYVEINGDADQSEIYVDQPVNEQFTFEWKVRFHSLPSDFTKITTDFIFFGAVDLQSNAGGFYLSRAGIAYSPCLGGGLEFLPGSQSILDEEREFTFRLAVDDLSGNAYFYVTASEDVGRIGHQLRFVLPAIPAAKAPVTILEGVMIAARGVSRAVKMELSGLSLASVFIVPNLPPVADAGVDQAVRTCSVIQLDGTKSFDPEGAPLLYGWRLVDAPNTSQYVEEFADGSTPTAANPPGAVFTEKLYSPSLNGVSVAVGSVLLVRGVAYPILGQGSNGHGYYVTVETPTLPVGLTGEPFKLIAQNGVVDFTTSKPRFYPDVAGFYKFDLIVYDGELVSEISTTVVNVVQSVVPRGITPNLNFFWNYLSNFWSLVDERGRIDTFWSAATQIVAAELLNLWQVDYDKSLRDIQRAIQRRWLHYTLKLAEPQVELTTLRVLPEILNSDDFVDGDPISGSLTITWAGGNTKTFSVSGATAALVLASIKTGLAGTGLTAFLYDDRTYSSKRIQICGHDITVTASTTTLYTTNQVSAKVAGISGCLPVAPRTFRIPNTTLVGLGLKEDDLFVNSGRTYRVVRIADDAGDALSWSRVVVKEDIPLSSDTDWAFVDKVTSTQLDFWSGLVTAGDQVTIEVIDLETDVLTYVTATTKGVSEILPKQLGLDLSAAYPYLANPTKYAVYFSSVLRLGYLPLNDLVVDIPFLQEKIANAKDGDVLHRNVDFYLESFRGSNALRFDVRIWDDNKIPERLWAEFTYLDNRPVIEANFGVPAEFTLDHLEELDSDLDYLAAVKGLWYAYLNGPTVENIKIGTQILLGLPFAEEQGIVEEVRTDFSPTQGRILIRDRDATEVVRSYHFPIELAVATNPKTGVAYTVGDDVTLFAPLVEGVEVYDFISKPDWYERYLSQGVFLEVGKFWKFMVRVDSDAFNLSALLFAKTFVHRIKPTATLGIFIVLKTVDPTEISVTDVLTTTVKVDLFDGAYFNTKGEASMFDDPRAGGNTDVDGGLRWRNRFDEDQDPDDAAPVYPTAEDVTWAFDSDHLSPDEYLLCTACEDFTGTDPLTGLPYGDPFTPPFESIFYFDTPVYLASDTSFTTPIEWAFDTTLAADVYCARLELVP